LTTSVRYRATLAYVGTQFHGWQIQRNADRTVQAVVEAALTRFAGAPVRVVAAGRTDAGVHADGQVVHFDLPEARGRQAIREGANTLLPGDVTLLEVVEARQSFHARRDAAWKEYVYRWSRAEVIAPRDSPFVAAISRACDPARMADAAEALPGTHDFGVFGVRLPAGAAPPTVRTLYGVAIEEVGEQIRAVFRGDGFLRGMVRSLCGVLADVGRGKAPPSRIAELLTTGERRLLAPKAPAKGLTLSRVHYGAG